MVRTPDLERRRQLLDALFDEFAAGGIGDRSLRDVAAAVGTSHRMLLHHFGSREDLLVAIVEEVERRQMGSAPRSAHGSGRQASPPCGPTCIGPNFATWNASSSSATPARPRARSRSTAWSPALSTAGSPRSRPSPASAFDPCDGAGSGWPSPAACCWIWWPPTTRPAWTRPRTPSRICSGG